MSERERQGYMYLILRHRRVRVELIITGESRARYHVRFNHRVWLRGRWVEIGEEIAVQKRVVILQEEE